MHRRASTGQRNDHMVSRRQAQRQRPPATSAHTPQHSKIGEIAGCIHEQSASVLLSRIADCQKIFWEGTCGLRLALASTDLPKGYLLHHACSLQTTQQLRHRAVASYMHWPNPRRAVRVDGCQAASICLDARRPWHEGPQAWGACHS